MSRTGIYAQAVLELASGALNLLSSGIKVFPVTAAYVQDFDTDAVLTDVPAGARAASPQTLAGKTLTRIQDTIVLRAAAVSFPSVAYGPNIVGLVMFEDTGIEATSRLVGYFDYFSNLPLAPAGVNITFNWPPYGIFVLLNGVLGGPQGIPGPAGGSQVASDIDSTDNTLIDQVVGIHGIPISGVWGEAPVVGSSLVFNAVGGLSWKKKTPHVFDVTDYGAKGDGVTDDTVAIQQTIAAASLVFGTVFFPQGTYLISAELVMVTESVKLVGSGRLTIIQATAPMRSLIHCKRTSCEVSSLYLKGEMLANYGIYCTLAGGTKFDDVFITRALFDGWHLAALRDADDTGTDSNNDNLRFFNCTAYLCGRVFAASYGSGINLNPIAAAGTVTINAYSDTCTGAGTNFTDSEARPGDFIRIGTAPNDVTLEILSVDDDSTIKFHANMIPEVTMIGAPYVIGVGDGYHDALGGIDNSRALFQGGLMRGCAGNGIASRALYGPTITNVQFDTMGMSGIVLGSPISSGNLGTSIINVYFEGQSGPTASLFVINALGWTCDQPTWDGAARKEIVYRGCNRYTGVVNDSTGTRRYGGLHEDIQGFYRKYVGSPGFQSRGMFRFEADISDACAAASSPRRVIQIPIPAGNQAGSVDIDCVGFYTDLGVPKRGRRKVSVGYTRSSGVITFGTVDDETPINQMNASVLAPTFTQAGTTDFVEVNILANTSGTDGIYYQGTIVARVSL